MREIAVFCRLGSGRGAVRERLVVQVSDCDFAAIDPALIQVARSIKTDGWHYGVRYAGGSLANYICPPPPGYINDHRDMNGLNNQRENLRFATHRQNMLNRRIQRYEERGLPFGVSHAACGRYKAAACRTYLGTFDTIEEAAREVSSRQAQDPDAQFSHRMQICNG